MPDRTTIVMPEALKRRAVNRAREQGISFGELVRTAVEKAISAGRARRVKKGASYLDNAIIYEDDGPADWSTRIDDVVYGEFDADLRGHERVSSLSSKKSSISSRSAASVVKTSRSLRHK